LYKEKTMTQADGQTSTKPMSRKDYYGLAAVAVVVIVVLVGGFKWLEANEARTAEEEARARADHQELLAARKNYTVLRITPEKPTVKVRPRDDVDEVVVLFCERPDIGNPFVEVDWEKSKRGAANALSWPGDDAVDDRHNTRITCN
jgi:hypothetical protein